MGHISKRTLHSILAVVVVLIVLFFAVTRTQVGRDALARQLESQFEQATGASLVIGQLTGNVMQDLFASNVEIRASSGTLLASVDSMVVRPRWTSLLQREFSIHQIRLFRPILDLGILSDSSEADLLFLSSRPASIPDSTDRLNSTGKWQFRNATLRIEEGRLLNVPSVQHMVLTDVESIALMSILSWDEEGGQVDLLSLSARMPAQRVEISSGSAQAVFKEDLWSINQARFQTENSTLQLRGSVATADPSINWMDRPFQIEIEPSNIDFDELHRLVPDLPIRDSATIAAYVSGPISDIAVPWVRLEKGASRISAEGTAIGYPDSIQVEFSISDVQLIPSDLRELLPTNRRLRNLRAEISNFQLYSNGTIQLSRTQPANLALAEVRNRSTFDLSSTAGLVSGTLSLAGSAADSLNHVLALRIEGVNGYPWTSRPQWASSLSGYLSLEGVLQDSARFTSDLTGQLSDVRWGKRRADSLDLDLTVNPNQVEGGLDLYTGDGMLESRFSLYRTEDAGLEIRSQSNAQDLDVGPLIGRADLQSRINALLTGRARLQWNDSFSAVVSAEVDSSRLDVRGDATDVPPHSIDITVSPPGLGSPVVELRSDMVDLDIDSEVSLPTMVALSRAWISTFNAALDQESRKLLNDSALEAADPEVMLGEWLTADAARERFPAGRATATSSVQLHLHSGEIVSALSPSFPDLQGSGQLEMDITWSADSLQAIASGRSDQFRYAGVTFVSPRVDATTSLMRGASILSTMSSTLTAVSDSLQLGGSSFSSNRLRWDVADGRGVAHLSSDGTQRLESIQLQADWEHRNDLNLLRFSDFRMDTGDGAWLLDDTASFGLFGDATTLDRLRIAFQRNDLPTGQSVVAGGTFSASESDSLTVAFSELELRPLSEFMQWKRTLGGLFNADLVVRGGYRQPRITGSVSVDTLSMDHYILGNATLTSNYVASRPEVAVDLRLDPIAPNDRAVLFGTQMPASVLQNQLQVAGDVRFPGRGSEEDGRLNLEATIDQADVFWLEYIFPEVLGSVSGYLSGDGRITGSFAYPVFDVRLGVVDGLFHIPYTQATYTASGTLRMDEEAIHFEPLRLEDETGGRLEVNGRLLFNQYTSFTFDMEGRLDEFQIMNVAESEELPFYGFIWASGDLSLTGPLFNARLVSTNGSTTENSELFIPIEEETRDTDQAFIVFEDTPGVIPDFRQLESRTSILQRRPTSERQFLDGLNLDLNIDAPPGSIVHLVIDPLLGDVINAVSAGNVQLILENDEFQVFGRLDVTSGDYQFTAGELFIKTFLINPGGFIEWSGDPINATLNIPASYRTRASRAGLPGAEGERPGVIPLIVDLQIAGTVESPEVDLSLEIDRSNQNVLGEYQALEALLNQPDRATEYATSVLILNSFQLTTESITTDSGGQLAFNSVSQLVTAQLNRFLESALPNVDFSLGLQGESAQDLDVTYGVALRLLNERLIIRGEGVYQGARSTESVRTSDGLQGEFVVEIRVGPRVSVEVFFRRESDILESTQLTNTAGVGLSYQTEFESWRSIIRSDDTQR